MDNNKKPIDSFYRKYYKDNDESTFSGLQRDIIYSLGSEKKRSWFSKNFQFRSLKDSR